MAGYFVFLQNTVTRFDRTKHFLICLFLIIFDQFNYKISGNTVETTRQTTHDAKSKQVEKKLKKSDRNEKIELRKKLESDRNEKIVLFDEKSFKLSI